MSTTTLKPEEVKKKFLALQEEHEETRKQFEEAQAKGREIYQKIRELQNQCPHENTKNVPVMDVAEMKYRDFCTDCGAEL